MLCFGVVLCFDDVVLCFVRRHTSCFASTTRSAFRSRSGLLCATPCFARRRALLRHAALRGESISLLCLSLPLLSLSLPWRRRSLPFLVPFSQEEHRANTGGPGPRLLRAFPMCLPLAAFAGAQSPAIEKKIALRALSAFGAINSTPRGGGAPICTNKST